MVLVGCELMEPGGALGANQLTLFFENSAAVVRLRGAEETACSRAPMRRSNPRRLLSFSLFFPRFRRQNGRGCLFYGGF